MAHAILFHQLFAYLALSSLFHLGVALCEADEPIVRLDCSPGVACITHYGAVLPQPFNRTDGGAASTYGHTNATDIPGFARELQDLWMVGLGAVARVQLRGAGKPITKN